MSEEYARATCAFAIRLLVIKGKRVVPTLETEVALLGFASNVMGHVRFGFAA